MEPNYANLPLFIEEQQQQQQQQQPVEVPQQEEPSIVAPSTPSRKYFFLNFSQINADKNLPEMIF